MKNLLFIILLITAVACSSCSSQKKLVQTDLYFGLSQGGGKIISDSAWNDFVQRHICKTFTEGFTVIKASGKWIDKDDNLLHSEPSYIITSLNKMNAHLSKNIDSLRGAYKQLFQQQSVLRVDKKTKAAF